MTPRFLVKDPLPRSGRRPSPTGTDGATATLGLDLDGRIVQWSLAAAELFDRPAARALGRDVTELLTRGEDDERAKHALAEVIAGRRWNGPMDLRAAADLARDLDVSWDPATGGGAIAVITICPATTPCHQAGTPPTTGQQRLALLNEASTRIGTTLDLGQTAAELMDMAVPLVADAAGILVRERLVADDEFPDRTHDGEAVVRRVAVAVADDDPAAWLAAFPVDEVTVYPAWSPYARCMATARTILVSRMDTELAKEIGRRMWRRESVFRALDSTSFLLVPLKARGRVLGFVVLTRNPGRAAFDDQDVSLAEELAARAAVCIDNARLYNRERRTALTLQSSLLPARLPAPMGLEIAHRYLPASDLTGVGGDWYDVITLPGGRSALVVGDVMGHGTLAAATMGQLRTAVRTLAGLDLSPAEVLYRLDEMVQELDSLQIATCVYATYDPATARWALARAGHVPPLVVHPDGRTEALELPAGLPLGIGGACFEIRELRLPDEATLVLCTDGLVESRRRDIDEGIAALRAVLGGARRTPEELCDTAIDVLRPNHDRDDIALLLARVHPLTPDQTAEVTLPDEPQAVSCARRLVRATLRRWRIDNLCGNAELLISELVTNALRHGCGPIGVRLLRAATCLVVEVADGSPVPPAPRIADPLAEAGRGMQLIKLLARRWGTRPTPTGKIVWFELEIASAGC
jgi:serine phosphatase RsbU (regulator of sigma subunit)/anti-sigma regulatory factor (Ser/Thr protein kinase)